MNRKDIFRYNSNNLDIQLCCQKNKQSTLSIKQKNVAEIIRFLKYQKQIQFN